MSAATTKPSKTFAAIISSNRKKSEEHWAKKHYFHK